jgi:hypothetical protein
MLESELCQQFISWIKPQGYKVYPEVKGWDMVVVPTSGRVLREPSGGQVGIHAKLRGNVEVLAQCLDKGPGTRFVLVPWASWEFKRVANALGLGVICFCRKRKVMDEWEYFGGFEIWGESKVWTTTEFWLPPIETDRPCGVQSPQSLTPWRVKALEICRLFESKGVLTSKDFKRVGINMNTWVQAEWIKPVGRSGRLTTYALGQYHPGLGWEKEMDAIKALMPSQNSDILKEPDEPT